MANTKSALKYIRKTETRSLRNRQVKTRLKTFAKKVAAASAAGDKEALAVAARDFISTLDKAGKNGLVHPNKICLLYTSPSPRDGLLSRMPSSA